MPRIRMASDGNLMNPPGKFQRKWSKGTEIDCTDLEADALAARGVSYSKVSVREDAPEPKKVTKKASSRRG